MAQSAAAQDADQLAASLAVEVEISATEAGALGQAAQFEQQGDLTAATAVLERYLIGDREAVEPRAQYAILLCRLDDVAAGRFEQSKLASIPAGSAVMNRVGAACGGDVASAGAEEGSARP